MPRVPHVGSFPYRVYHGRHVFWRHVWQQGFMAGGYDIIRTEQVPQAADFFPYLFGRAEGKDTLGIHAAHKHNLAVVLA